MPPVLILPGLGNSGPEHWQTHWEKQHPAFARVGQRDWDNPDRDEWIATLEGAIARQSAPPLLVAHSLACALVAHWAARQYAAGPWRAAGGTEGRDDGLVRVRPLLDLVADWRAFLGSGLSEDERDTIRAGERTGRPLGSDRFTARLEKRLGRTLARQKPGPKPKASGQR